MNAVAANDIHALEAKFEIDARLIERADTALPLEQAPKPLGVFSSDCCGCNNYPK
jgi:hypothetical protein